MVADSLVLMVGFFVDIDTVAAKALKGKTKPTKNSTKIETLIIFFLEIDIESFVHA